MRHHGVAGHGEWNWQIGTSDVRQSFSGHCFSHLNSRAVTDVKVSQWYCPPISIEIAQCLDPVTYLLLHLCSLPQELDLARPQM